MTRPKTFKNYSSKENRKFCSCLAIVDQSGQKNRNGETIAVYISHGFLLHLIRYFVFDIISINYPIKLSKR